MILSKSIHINQSKLNYTAKQHSLGLRIVSVVKRIRYLARQPLEQNPRRQMDNEISGESNK